MKGNVAKTVKKMSMDMDCKITESVKEEDFQLSDKEKELIRSLFSWSKQSEETNWVLGQPV